MKSGRTFALTVLSCLSLAASWFATPVRADDTSRCMAEERSSIEQLKTQQHELLKNLNVSHISSVVNQSHGADNLAINDAKNRTRVTKNAKTGKNDFTVGAVVATDGTCLSYDAGQLTKILTAELNRRQGMWAAAEAGATALAGLNNSSTYGSAISDSYNNPSYTPASQTQTAKRSSNNGTSAAAN